MDESFEDIAEVHAWDDATVVGILIEFIDNYADKASLIEFARRKAEDDDPAQGVPGRRD